MWSLKRRLLSVAGITGFLLGAAASWSTWQFYRHEKNKAAEEVSLLAQALAGEGGRMMGSARQLLDLLSTLPVIQGAVTQGGVIQGAVIRGEGAGDSDCGEELRLIHRRLPQYALLAVADRSGMVFCSSPPVAPGVDVSAFPWFRQALGSPAGLNVSGYVVGELTGRPVVQLSQRGEGAGGPVVILAALEMEALSAALRDVRLPADTQVTLVDRGGRILYRHPDREGMTGGAYPDQRLVAIIAARRQGVEMGEGVDGERRIVGFMPLFAGLDTGISVMVGRSEERVLEPARRHLLVNLLMTMLSLAAATAFAWFGAGRAMVTPIRRLSEVAKAMAAGNSRARVGPLTVSTELHDLAVSFDRMADALSQRQEELETALERLESTTELARIGIFDWDVASGVIIWNRQHYLLFGYDPDADASSFDAFQRRLHPEDSGAVGEALEAARQSRQEYRIEYRIILPSGEIRWILGCGRFTYDAAGEAARMRGVVIDITDRRKAEESLHRVQKMDALGHMTGGIAHDVNNILGIVSANLQLMQLHPSAATIEEGVETALAAADRGAGLIRRLLAFSRRQPGRILSCDIGEELAKLKPLLEKTVPKNISIGVFISPALWRARMEPAEFGDALLNLAINSAHAMPQGGRLHIEAANVVADEAGLVVGSDLPPGDYVVIAVSDDGTGIAPDILEKVFEPFFTTRERSQGSGLGLSMVYGFARRCGGSVRIYSEAGQGTTVRLYLPRADAVSSSHTDGDVVTVPSGGGETVMIVEDEGGILRAAEAYLRNLGYRTLIAERPAEALALFGEVGRIDLLFSDIVMPGSINGIDLANRLRGLQPDLKVLLTTGFAESAPKRQDPGHSYPVLDKPYRLIDLGCRIRALLDGDKTVL